MWAAQKARAEHDVGVAGEDGLDEDRILVGVVFEVGILDQRDVAGDGRDRGADGGALAGVLGVEEHADAVVGVAVGLGADGAHQVSGAVGRRVVDDDDLLADGHGAHALDQLADRQALVEHGHQDREHEILPHRGSLMDTSALASAGAGLRVRASAGSPRARTRTRSRESVHRLARQA
jgi:hypothetical protein